VNYSRRDIGLLLPALAAASAQAQSQQDGKVLPARAYKYEELPVKVNKTSRGRAVLNGETHSGFPIEMHLTELDPGQAPHAPHRHVHEEIFMLREGTVDMTISGQTTRLAAGSVAYVASNELHGLVNSGSEAAHYFVIALGNDKT
jgi:quercetin dioxygenase-like cupin family protein